MFFLSNLRGTIISKGIPLPAAAAFSSCKKEEFSRLSVTQQIKITYAVAQIKNSAVDQEEKKTASVVTNI